MTRPIDTLFYNWVVTEDEKNIPTVIEDISEMENADKIDALLTEYAACVTELIEAEVIRRSVIDEKVFEASSDPELAEADGDLLAQAIQESDDVMEAEEYVEATKNAVDLLHTSLVKVLSREV